MLRRFKIGTPFLLSETVIFSWPWFLLRNIPPNYHQIPVVSEDIPKTAISPPFGLFEFTWMTFGRKPPRDSHTTKLGVLFRLVGLFASSTEFKHFECIFQRLLDYGLVGFGKLLPSFPVQSRSPSESLLHVFLFEPKTMELREVVWSRAIVYTLEIIKQRW